MFSWNLKEEDEDSMDKMDFLPEKNSVFEDFLYFFTNLPVENI